MIQIYLFHPDVPSFVFYSEIDLLRGLIAKFGIDDVNMEDLCSFREYCKERESRSHTRAAVEEKLVENEIGGVILGSLTAGTLRRHLSKKEYLEERRSNISNKTEHGKAIRNDVYTEFEKYRKWKRVHRKAHDVNDVVLMLLNDSNLKQIFDSGEP